MYIKAILTMNELNIIAESTPIVLNITIPISSLTPNPEIPIGNANSIIMDSNANTKKIFIISTYCPKDKNRKKNSNASKKFFISVIYVLCIMYLLCFF